MNIIDEPFWRCSRLEHNENPQVCYRRKGCSKVKKSKYGDPECLGITYGPI